MSRTCTLLMHLALCIPCGLAGLLAVPLGAQTPAKCVVHGVLPVGARLEFLAQGSPDRITAKSGEGGKYAVDLPPARYEVTVVLSDGRRESGFASLINPDNTINAEPAASLKAASASSQQYDLLADWRVIDKSKRGLAAKISLQAELTSGRIEKLSTWVLSGLGDEEKETDSAFETTPDGRAPFRIRESRFRVDRVVALRVKVEASGRAPVEVRIAPVLEFSSSGHFHAVYPDQYEIIFP